MVMPEEDAYDVRANVARTRTSIVNGPLDTSPVPRKAATPHPCLAPPCERDIFPVRALLYQFYQKVAAHQMRGIDLLFAPVTDEVGHEILPTVAICEPHSVSARLSAPIPSYNRSGLGRVQMLHTDAPTRIDSSYLPGDLCGVNEKGGSA